MKALRLTALGVTLALVALAVAAGALALAAIDGDAVRDALAARLESALGSPVELGAVHVSLFPLPGVRIRDARIGEPAARWLEAPELRARVSVAGLVAGQIVLRSLELDAPRIRVPDAAPAAAQKSARSAPESVRFAITRLEIRDGRIEVGPIALERVSLAGSLIGAESAQLELDAEIPRVGHVRGGRIELAELAQPARDWRWTARATLPAVDLSELRAALGLPGLWGSAAGTISASGRGPASERVSLELESEALDLRGVLARATGRTRLTAEFPGEIAVDFGAAELELAQSLVKPSGVPLRLTATLGSPARALHFGALRIESPGIRAEGALDLGSERPVLALERASVDLGALAAWRAPARMPKSGRIELSSARVTGDPLAVHAEGELANVLVPVTPEVTLRVSGPAATDGTTVSGRGLRVAFGEDEIEVSGHYDWSDSTLVLAARSQGARIGPLAEALWRRKDVSGRLYGEVELAGGLGLETLRGGGSFDLHEGEWPGISMARAAGLPRSFDEPPGLDRFERLVGRFETAGDHWNISELTLTQEFVTAQLEGKLWLDGPRVDLSGAVELDFPELSEPMVRALPRVGGTLDSLEIVVSDERSDEVKNMEAQMIEEIRKTEERERAERKAAGQKSTE